MCFSLWFNFYIAICNKSCLNGGTCIAPEKCSCKPGYTGEQCAAGNMCFVILMYVI